MWIDKNTFSFAKFLNRQKTILSYRKGRVNCDHSPSELILEITNHCNLECIMCPRPNMKRKLGFMSFDLFKTIIDQVKNKVELVYLAGGLGEPTIHPRLKEMIEYCKVTDVRVGISTNATLLNDKICDAILSSRPDVMLLSLDGATCETHEKIRIGSDFKKTMEGVERFLRKKEEKGCKEIFTIVQMIYMPENSFEAALFRKKWNKFNSVNDIRLKKFLHLQGADHYPEVESSERSNLPMVCIHPWRQMAISWNGTVAICCRDYNYRHLLGDLTKQTISEVWNGTKMKTYRYLLASGQKEKIELCKNCAGMATNFPMRIACVIFDDYTIRKILPIIEKTILKLNIKMFDYK
jgi:radical SAM protein with 4Fe4S-binding SPASM domain